MPLKFLVLVALLLLAQGKTVIYQDLLRSINVPISRTDPSFPLSPILLVDPSVNAQCSQALNLGTSQLPYSEDASTADSTGLSDLSCGVDSNDEGVWYQLKLDEDAIAVATVSNQDFSAKLSVFSGSCGSLNCVSSTSAIRYSSRVLQWAAEAGTTYYVLVSGSVGGNFKLSILVRVEVYFVFLWLYSFLTILMLLFCY